MAERTRSGTGTVREEPKPRPRDYCPKRLRDKAKEDEGGKLGEARLKEKTKENPEKEGDPAKLSNGNDKLLPARDPGKKDSAAQESHRQPKGT